VKGHTIETTEGLVRIVDKLTPSAGEMLLRSDDGRLFERAPGSDAWRPVHSTCAEPEPYGRAATEAPCFAVLDSHGNPLVVRSFAEVSSLATRLHAPRLWHFRRRRLFRLVLADGNDLLNELRSAQGQQ
jgi:hypothetical protein